MKNTFVKRTLSVLLCMALILSFLPGQLLRTKAANGDTGILSSETVTDPSTLNAWKDTAFNPTNLSTEHAGGVWTDKTVVKAADADAVFVDKNGNPLGITAGTNNFLVALSALGANSVVEGQGTTPTDTIFVLDVSNSMQNTDLSAMVSATNDSIHSLLNANSANRVGVVVYATNVNILLPLDRYTPVQKGSGYNATTAYIEMSSNYSEIRTARTGNFNATYVKNSAGRNVTTSISASGATYIQGGLWQAYQMFENATVSDDRTPVLVLMSDGAPTYGTKNYYQVKTNSRDVGGGGDSSVTDGLAFLTQLTAAYVKEEIADKYNSAAYFYTVGLGVSGSGQNVSIAEAVLDTSKTRQNPQNWWNTYLGLANITNKTMSFSAAGSNVTITYNATVTSASKNYTDRYFPASDASQLSSAFQGIVNEINLKASYNVTRIEGNDANSSGYVTFVDEIGTGMQVKNIKGILIGDTLYTGANLAKALLNSEFGTAENPTDLGNNMVWALKQRLGVTDLVMNTANGPVTITATERIHDLIRRAYEAGQIAYNDRTGEFSNLIGWFSDENGDYLGFWDATDPNCAIPAGAAYANASYGMLGTTTASQTAHASDMMYVAVMVSKKITQVGGVPTLEAKTPELVTFRVPASLLPTVTYQISVNVSDGEQITEQTAATITYNAADPIRLVYEVGAHSALTPENIQDFLREGYASKDADGNYYLYTNAWYWEPSTGVADPLNPPNKDNAVGKDVLYDTGKNHITYAYFEPGEQNEHYYFTEDTDLYTYNGTSYVKLTTAPVTDGSVQYYFQHKTYVSKAPAAKTGVEVDAKVHIHYGEVEDKLLQDRGNFAVDAATGVYYIKEGTMHYGTIHAHDQNKTTNATGSFQYRLHQLVDIAVDGNDVATHNFEIVYMGNNGRITYSPAQGFTLNKVMAAGATATDAFTFEVTVSGDADNKYTETRNGVSVQKDIENNAFILSLKAGESVTVTGLDVGATYTVTEQEQHGYTLGGIVVSAGAVNGATASGTVADNQIHSITYTNDVESYGSLLVSKSVTYNKNSQPQTDPHIFPITVELAGMAGKQVYVGGVLTTLDAQGKTQLNLTAGGQVLITGIIAGTQYTVTEDATALTPGYSVVDGTFSGTVTKDQVAVAGVKNAYTPEDVVVSTTDPQISVDVTKNFYLYNGVNGYLFDESRSFTFELLKNDPATNRWVPATVGGNAITATTTFTNPDTNEDPALGTNTNTGIVLDVKGLTFDSAGRHYFRIAEVIPDAQEQLAGMAYDRTHHDFVVEVADIDLNGQLEIVAVNLVDDTITITPTDTNSDGENDKWHVSTTFNNSQIIHATKLTIGAKKTLSGASLKNGQFTFALYKTGADFAIDGITPITARNGASGDVVFLTETYTYNANETKYYYVMQETSASGNGVTVDGKVWEIEVTVTSEGTEAQVKGIKYRQKGQTAWEGEITGAPQNNIFNAITFQNTYKAEPVTVELPGRKTLTNLTPGVAEADRDMTATIAAGDFRFELVPAGQTKIDLLLPSGVERGLNNRQAAVQAGGRIDLLDGGKLYYDVAGSYEYKVKETQSNRAGVTMDSTEYTVKVDVVDNGLGQLVATATYWIGDVQANEIVFNNTYKADPATGLNIHAEKVLNVPSTFDRPLNANDFRVTLTHPDGGEETVYNDANGIFTFAELGFEAVGTYEYAISEIIPVHAVNNQLAGVTYDPVTKNFTIVVEDSGDGKLVAKLNGTELLTDTNNLLVATVTNSYKAEPTYVNLLAHKDLDGRKLNANEFSFKVEALTANAPMPQNTVVKNDEAGNVDFGSITYSAVGVYQYKVTEQKLDKNGNPLTPDSTGAYVYENVTYSAKEYTVTVRVDDLRNGNLIAHVSSVDETGTPQAGGVVFTNTYVPDNVATTIKIQKELVNKTDEEMGLDGFRFLLEGEDFEQILTSDSEGKAELTLEFSQENIGQTYTFKLSEVEGNTSYMRYDNTVYEFDITISQAEDGRLLIAIERENSGTFTFVNTYYGAPQNEIPKTGDNSMLGLAATLMVASVACLFVLVVNRKRMVG